MHLTRSIRRKLMFALALILAMLMFLSISGATGLLAYAKLIDEFQFSISDAPRHSDLVRAIGLMFEPFEIKPDEDTAFYQQGLLQERIDGARAEIATYHRKLDDLNPTEAVVLWRPVIVTYLEDLETRISNVEAMNPDLLDEHQREATTFKILKELVELQKSAQNAPAHHDGLRSALDKASGSYRSRLLWILCTTGVVIAMFAYLVRFSYMSVFAPLKKLHQGAQRVAQGDFDYRVDINTHDEVAELASSFNRMTARFQEITRDLDRQVRERSKQLVRSDRLAGIGLFAAGVAHEINNPLSAISTAAEALEYRQHEEEARKRASAAQANATADEESEQDTTLRTYLKIIQDEAFRCQTITRRILDFARPQEASRMPCDIAKVVDEVISLVGLMSKYRGMNIEFSHSRPCVIEINGPEIKQVVLNLVTNALESMDVGRTLRISLTEQTDQIYLTLDDEGCGMTQEIIDNLFEPFFTRRKDGRGTGLGMSISSRIVADHGGRIEVSSDGPGKGSTFVVHLPRKASFAKSAA